MKKKNYAINVFIFKLNKPDWVYKKNKKGKEVLHRKSSECNRTR